MITVRRVLPSPDSGECPRIMVYGKNSVYLGRGDDAIVVTRLYQNYVESEPYSELAWFLKEEVRILSAINLARGYGQFTFQLDEPPKLIQYTELQGLVKSKWFRLVDVLDIVCQLAFGEAGLDIQQGYWDKQLINQVFSHRPNALLKMIGTDHLPLLRCLGLWLKANMLWGHACFREEACALLYFALDGLVKLYQERVHRDTPNASFEQVGEYMATVVEGSPGITDYLRECHQNRTMLVHPLNQYDEHWNVPLIADDFYETAELFKEFARAYVMKVQGEIN